MAVDDYVGLHVVGRYQSQNIVNTFTYRIAGQTVTDHNVLTQLVEGWNTAFATIWVTRHIASYFLIGVKAFSLTGGNKRPGILEIGTPGTVVGTEAPSSLCRVITLYTDSVNYRKRGRVMLSGCDIAMFDAIDGAVTAVERLALATLADAWLDTITEDDESFAPYLPPVDIVPGEAITATLPRKTPGTIRSRRVRGFSIG